MTATRGVAGALERYFPLWAALIVTLALLLRVHSLDRESFFIDEIRQSAAYGLSLPALIRESARQSLPPLDYWLGHLVSLFSTSDFALRLPAALFGTASVAILMLLARRLFSAGKSLFAGAFLALLPFHLHFSQELRPYSSAIFLTILTLAIMERFLRKGMDARSFVAAYLAFFAFLMTRPEGPLIFLVTFCLIVVVLALIRKNPNREQGAPSARDHLLFLSCAALAMASFWPFLRQIVAMSPQYVSTEQGFLSNALPKMNALSPYPLWTAFCVQLDPLGPVLFPLAILGALAAVFQKGTSRNAFLAACGGVLLIVPTVHLFAWRLIAKSELQPAYLFYLAPMSILLVLCLADAAGGLAERHFPGETKGATAILAVLALLALASWTVIYKTTPHKEDWKGLCRYVEANFPQGGVLLFDQVMPMAGFNHTFFGFPRYHWPGDGASRSETPPGVEEIRLPAGYRPNPVFKNPFFPDFYSSWGFFDLQLTPPKFVSANPEHGPVISVATLQTMDPWGRDMLRWQDRVFSSGFGKATHVSLLPFIPFSERDLQREPSVILYHQEGKYLTKASLYPYRRSDYTLKPNTDLLEKNPALRIVRFKEFILVRPSRPTQDLKRDALTLFEAILPAFPNDSSRIDPLLTTAWLEKTLGTGPWEKRILEILDIVVKEKMDVRQLEELYREYISFGRF